MFLARARIGPVRGGRRSELEDLVEGYLRSLVMDGQAGRLSFELWDKDYLHIYVEIPRPDSIKADYLSPWGKTALDEMSDYCGKPPEWELLEKEIPRRFPRWQSAPSLVLYHLYWDDRKPPIRRLDNGAPIPAYLIPFKDQTVPWNIHVWQREYDHHVGVWFGTGALEIPAYRELADTSSVLASTGRELCTEIEKATSTPTYYFLFRHWGRRKGEADRKCPACGANWRLKKSIARPAIGWRIDFQCKKCRLVSEKAAYCDDERHARIGEFRGSANLV